MIFGFLLAQIIAGPVAANAYVIPAVKPAAVLQRYAVAIAKVKEPRVMTFDYTLDQSGIRALLQTHRVYRSGGDERDETLTVDGKRLSPPMIRIFLGRRSRYTVRALAPRLADYDFAFVGPRTNAHHTDYVFRLTPKMPRAFSVTTVTIDGVRFLPSSLDFVTGPSDGNGSIVFGANAAWWVPYIAMAKATIADATATEKLSFYTYRFPPALPPSTFGRARLVPRPLPAPRVGASRATRLGASPATRLGPTPAVPFIRLKPPHAIPTSLGAPPPL